MIHLVLATSFHSDVLVDSMLFASLFFLGKLFYSFYQVINIPKFLNKSVCNNIDILSNKILFYLQRYYIICKDNILFTKMLYIIFQKKLANYYTKNWNLENTYTSKV